MRIALCLYGYYNNRADKFAGDKGFNYINDKILSKCENVDIFVHSWDTSNEQTILTNYAPKYAIIEPQIDFNIIAANHGINQAKIDEGFNRQSTMYRTCSINASLSFFYSRTKSLELAFEYADEHNFKYDCVITCRFDLGQRGGFHLGYNVAQMNFDPTLDMNYIYSAMWVQINAGYADMWFFSNHENMKILSTMYHKALTDYFIIDGEYQKELTNGWRDSNSSNEFSNEFLNPTPNAIPVKYPRWQMINNHIIHKWHFITTGLYRKSKFIGDRR